MFWVYLTLGVVGAAAFYVIHDAKKDPRNQPAKKKH